MRIALVSPYSWTYPGGVTRHIEALAERFIADGHHVRVLAPYDPPGRFSGSLHRGARPQQLGAPDYLVPLGRTVGFKANGAVSNLSITPYGYATMQRELRTGGFDVVHVHEPIAPVISWVATDRAQLPTVGTFHVHSTNAITNGVARALGAGRVFNHLHVRIAVSEAAAWTARRFFGGHYRVIPNGVHVDPERARRAAERQPGEALRIAFVGQAVERKGLPLLLRAFEALREHVPCELTVIGPSAEELAPLMLDGRGVRALGKVDDQEKQRELERADVLCAPSLGGESFGMVLTEAFAAGTPVIASDIPGYRDVVRDGVDGVLVPRGDPRALAEALRDLHEEPARRGAMARAAATDVERFAWPHVAAEVLAAYEDAAATPAPQGVLQRTAVGVGARSADLKPIVRARRIAPLEPPALRPGRSPVAKLARRVAVSTVSLGCLALAAFALQRIGVGHVVAALIKSSPSLVLLGLGLMCGAMVLRAVSWHATLNAALPRARLKLADAMQGTFIGVLMSATLPARLGEPSRALIVARRSGRPRDDLPVVLGTLVSQTLLNVAALAALGAVMFTSVARLGSHQDALLITAAVPLAAFVLAFLVQTLLAPHAGGSGQLSPGQALVSRMRQALARVRTGLAVFRHPRLGLTAVFAQLSAWALQCLACFVLFRALGVDSHAGFGAAAAVLFAVNITAVLPITPANIGVFQAACVVVLHAGWHVGIPAAVAYGVILQAVEVSTAILMGAPALLKEGMSWREVKLRVMHATPVTLPDRAARRAEGALETRG